MNETTTTTATATTQSTMHDALWQIWNDNTEVKEDLDELDVILGISNVNDIAETGSIRCYVRTLQLSLQRLSQKMGSCNDAILELLKFTEQEGKTA